MDVKTFRSTYCRGFESPVSESFILNFQEEFDGKGLTLAIVQMATSERMGSEHACVADVTDSKSDRIRIGFYANNAWSYLEDLEPDETIETFAEAWYSNDREGTPTVLLDLVDLPDEDSADGDND